MAKNKITVEKGSKAPNNIDVKNKEINVNELPDKITEEQKEYARITVRNEFNSKFSKWAEIDPVNATDEDLEQIKKDFEDCVEENKNKTYLIATHQDGLALKTAEFLKDWNAKFNTNF